MKEISTNKELSIYAALAGITLSHQNIPVLGADNAMNGIANIGAVILVLGVVLAYLDERLATRDIAMRVVRTIAPIIYLYLIANGVKSVSLLLDGGLSAEEFSYISFMICLFTTAFIIDRVGFEGFMNVYREGKEIEKREGWSLWKRIALLSLRPLLAFIFILLVCYSTTGFCVSAVFGFSSALTISFALSVTFVRKKNISIKSNRKGESIVILPSSALVFMTVFDGTDWITQLF